MRNLFVWYLPQAALFGFGFYAAMTAPEMNIAGAAISGAFLAAAYTGAANIIISVSARLRRHRSEPSAERDSLAASGRLMSQGAQKGQRIRIGQDLR